MKNYKFIFVPMLATSVFIFSSLTVNADEKKYESQVRVQVTEETASSDTGNENTYIEGSHSTDGNSNSQQPSEILEDESITEPEQNITSSENNEKQSTELSQPAQKNDKGAPEKNKGVSSRYTNEVKNLNHDSVDTNDEQLDDNSLSIKDSIPPEDNELSTSSSETDEEKSVNTQDIKESTSQKPNSSKKTDDAPKDSISNKKLMDESDEKEKTTHKQNNKVKFIEKASDTHSENKTESEKIDSYSKIDLSENTSNEIDKAANDLENSFLKYEKQEKHNIDLKKDKKEEINNNSFPTFSLMSSNSKISSPTYSDISFAAKIKSSTNSGLRSPVTSTDTVSADFLLDKTIFIEHQATYGDEIFYRVHSSYDGAMQGWMNEKDLNTWSISKAERHNESFRVSSNNSFLLTDPWGTQKQHIKKLSTYGNQPFIATKILTLGSHTYYYGKLGNDYGWLEERKMHSLDEAPIYSEASYAAKLRTSNNSGLRSPVNSTDSVSADFLLNKAIFIEEQAEYAGETFYKVHSSHNGPMQGWMKKEDLNAYKLSKPRKHTEKFRISRKNSFLLADPWGTEKQHIKKLSSYGDQPFKATKVVTVGSLIYYYGKIGNDYGWLEERKMHSLDVPPIYTDITFAAKIKSSNNSGLRAPVTKPDTVSANFLLDKTIFIDNKADYAGETFYRVYSSYDGAKQGWMKKEDLNTWNISNPKNYSKNFSVHSKNSFLLTDPWGTEKQRIQRLKKYGNQPFQAEKVLTLGSHIYYYGKIGNDHGWVEKRKLKEYKPVAPSPSVKMVRHSQSLTQAVNTQMNLSSKPQAWANGGGWRNATRSEVQRFLDTSHQTSDTWMYTFLDLDRSQNIASSTLNSKLLNGKGTLNNQGSAFLNASKTHGINEVYLISHAIHETGNGSSTLAQGVRLDSNGNISSSGKKYYNMYGVGAYDYNPVLAGARYAQQMGWDTPAKAIVGGARFISQSYFNRGQTTLYSMRWNPMNPGTYQYATDVNWAYATARNLQGYYQQLGIRGQYYTKHIF